MSHFRAHEFEFYRQLSTDPMMVAKLGAGHFVVLAGALLIFATFFLSDDGYDLNCFPPVPRVTPQAQNSCVVRGQS